MDTREQLARDAIEMLNQQLAAGLLGMLVCGVIVIVALVLFVRSL
jgi:hypothetical protein